MHSQRLAQPATIIMLICVHQIVVRSKCPSYVGIEGILLQETQNTLKLISRDNCIRSELPYRVNFKCDVLIVSFRMQFPIVRNAIRLA